MKIIKFDINKEIKDLSLEQAFEYKGDNYWDWAVWIKGSDANLDKIEYVTYQLHNTFLKPVRVIMDRNSSFKLETAGWGNFTIYAMITFKDGTVKNVKHNLKLAYPPSSSDKRSDFAYAK